MPRHPVLLPLLLCAAPWMAASASATPETHYTRLCAICHLPGVHGAPKVGRQDDWIQRIRPGLNAVYRNAIEGIPNTAMLAKGGHTELSDAEVKAVVDYMIAATALPRSLLQDAARYDRLGITDRDFLRLDSSRDGYLSRNEVSADAVLLRNFQRFDSNRDGRLSESEYRTAEQVLERERAAATVGDADLEAAVRKALSSIKGIGFDYVKVEISSGALVMRGIVGHADVAINAYDAVKRIPGLKTISNRLVSGDQISWD